MERLDCAAVYIDDRVSSERWVSRGHPGASSAPNEPDSLLSDVEVLLAVCKQIYLCHAGTSFATKLAELNERSGSHCTPVFAFFDIEPDGEESVLARRKASRTSSSDLSPPSPTSLPYGFTFSSQSEDSYGLHLLSGVSADIQVQEAPNIIVPVAILRAAASASMSAQSGLEGQSDGQLSTDPQQIARCLDAGAVDVLTTPLNRSRIEGLLVHAYRTRKMAQKEMSRFLARRKLRKHSWVGVHDEQPYAYLREAMVSKLMKGICNPEDVIEEFQDRELDVSSDRERFVKERIGRWDFTAQEFSEDELVFGAGEMLQHALDMPELEQWRLTAGELRIFLLACRAAYNSFVLYHNFRHAIDVLQSTFCFLLHIGALPPYGQTQDPVEKSPMASILSPFVSLTLLISAIGHDVGHPGVNNFFLVKLNAPLAQLYNDNSVLEAFHCAAFSQILRRHWPSTFKDKQLRKLLISSILATDMGVHQKFMQRLGQLQEKFYENQKTLDGWKPQDIELYRSLICGLLIKCADISNVARPWAVAERWTKILQEEFANQGEMEKEVGMETALFGGPPEIGNVYKLATGQIGFMSIFAIPLFEGVSDLLPQMEFTVEQIRSNQSQWAHLAEVEKRKQSLHVGLESEDTPSPRTQSPKPARPIERESAIGTAEKKDAASVHAPEEQPTASSDSSSPAYNENTISPVVSPDTSGPSMDIAGFPYPPEAPSRKSSCAVPDVTMVSMGGSQEGDQNASHPPDARDTSRRPSDPAVLAAVIFANAAKNEEQGPAEVPTSAPSERPSSSRHGQFGHRCHASHNSASRTSGPSSSQRNSCTRTQSISTYSNPMTPISPATNATSFLTVDSGDEKGHRDSLGKSEHEHESGETDQQGQSDGRSHTSHQVEEAGKNNVTTTVVGNGTSSPAQSTTTAESSARNEPESAGAEQPPRRLAKRRSRLRLAFWRRKNHNSHQQEVSGET